MNGLRRRGVALEHVAARERVIEARGEVVPARDGHRLGADPRSRRSAAAVAEHNWRHSSWRRRHRMAIEQKRAAEAVEQQLQLLLDRAMEWPVRFDEPLLELALADRPTPQEAVLLRTGRDDAEPAACPCADAVAARALDHG